MSNSASAATAGPYSHDQYIRLGQSPIRVKAGRRYVLAMFVRAFRSVPKSNPADDEDVVNIGTQQTEQLSSETSARNDVKHSNDC